MFIELADPLDESQLYCVDVPGAGTAVMLNSPLQAHPWKRLVTAADEPFAFNHPADGQIYTDNYGSLRPARRTRWGNGRVYVTLAAWLDSQNQLFQLEGG